MPTRCHLFLFLQGLLDEPQDEVPLAELLPGPFRFAGQVVLDPVEQLLWDLKRQGLSGFHGLVSSRLIVIILGEYLCDVHAEGLAGLFPLLPHPVVEREGQLGTEAPAGR